MARTLLRPARPLALLALGRVLSRPRCSHRPLNPPLSIECVDFEPTGSPTPLARHLCSVHVLCLTCGAGGELSRKCPPPHSRIPSNSEHRKDEGKHRVYPELAALNFGWKIVSASMPASACRATKHGAPQKPPTARRSSKNKSPSLQKGSKTKITFF